MPREKPGFKVVCFYATPETHKKLRIQAAHAELSMADYASELVEKILNSESQSGEAIPNPADLCCEFLKELAEGKRPSNSKLVKLSHLLGVQPEILTTITDRYLDGGEVNVKGSTVSQV